MLYSLIAMAGGISSDATATQASANGGGSMLATFAPLLIMVVIFYFLLIRPQKKRDKETKNMLAAIKKGDKVATIGGIRGTVVSVKEGTVTLKVDDNVKIEFSKSAIAQVLNQSAGSAGSSKDSPKKEEKKVVEAKTEEIVYAPNSDGDKDDSNSEPDSLSE